MAEKPKRQVELIKREPAELQQLYLRLMSFLLDNPEYQFIETDNGVQVVISPFKAVEKSALAGVPDKPLIEKMPQMATRPRKQPSLKAFQKAQRKKNPMSVKDALILEEYELAKTEQNLIAKIMRQIPGPKVSPKKHAYWKQRTADSTVRVFNARQKADRVIKRLFRERTVA